MATNVLDSTHPTIDPDRPTRTHATIGEEWQIIYSQGGIVMSTMLRAATRVLARPDLQLSAMSATFIKPVPMGDVVIDVEVLRSGRNGAQTSIELRDATSAANGDGPNTVITAVFIAADDNAPTVRSLSCPHELLGTPTPEHVAATAPREQAFLERTDWVLTPEQPDDTNRQLMWFRFHEAPLTDDGTWERSTLVVPADTLGTAIHSAMMAKGDREVFSVSLQITVQFHADAHGEWVGVDSSVWDISNGLASGPASLWDTDGTLVATVTQTAKLRLEW
ncbi:MAG: thioesterase family protein [Microthrixaceae bacterium]